MKAVIQTAYGAPSVLQVTTLSRPVPRDNEILVRIIASSVTAADSMMRRGSPWYGRLFLGFFKPRFPVPGTGFSGIVEAAGAGVKRFKAGDAVFGESVFGSGTNAEYVCVSEEGVVIHKPVSISHAEAAPACDGIMTAMNFLCKLGKLKAGQKILINGAAGSLGSAAVQIGRHMDAHVTGVCSTGNIDFVRSLGADEVIDYTQDSIASRSNTYDLIFDSVGKLSVSSGIPLLKEGGTLLSPALRIADLTAMLLSKYFGSKRVLFSATGLLPEHERRALLEDLTNWLSKGAIKTIVDRRYQLSDIVSAHQYVDTGHKRANIVVEEGA